MNDEFEYIVFLEQNKQKLYFDDEIEALRVRKIAIEAELYCWMIYIKK